MNTMTSYQAIYQNLRHIADFNESTALCIYEPKNLLFVVKREGKETKSIYEKLQSLESPHLSRVLFIAETEKGIDVMQEYVSGISLDALLACGTTLSRERAMKIIADVCDGLCAMHRHGLVHRDINPNNIIIGNDGSATIIDFGIAREYSFEKNADTMILGTPGYAAPEQFGFSQSNEKTDIYAVGVLLNVLLTGELPNVRRAGGTLGRIVGKCVEVDSGRRYKSIEALNHSVSRLVSYNGPADRFVSLIPGLRSKKLPVVIFSMLGYLTFILFSAIILGTCEKGQFVGTFFSWLLIFPIPFFCFHNFLGIWDRLPFSKGSSKHNQAIIYAGLGIGSILLGLFLFACIN